MRGVCMITISATACIVSVCYTLVIRKKRPTWKQIGRDIELALWLPLVWYGYVDVYSLSKAVTKKWFP
jgi:hypothetical protein